MSPSQTPRGRPPSTWRNTPSRRTRLSSPPSPVPLAASPAPASAWPIPVMRNCRGEAEPVINNEKLLICERKINVFKSDQGRLFFLRLPLSNLNLIISCVCKSPLTRIVLGSFRRSFLLPTKIMGTLGQKCFTSGVHFSGIFSSESGESTEKHMRMTSVSG